MSKNYIYFIADPRSVATDHDLYHQGIIFNDNRYLVRAGKPRKNLGQYLTLQEAINTLSEYNYNPADFLAKLASSPRKYNHTPK